jgi:putative phage-type endonuclease
LTIEKLDITSHAEWLDWRRKDVTASDVAAICGLDPHRSPLQVALEKTGKAPGSGETPLMRRGRWLEPAVAAALRETRPKWSVKKASVYLRDPEIRLGATPDYVAASPKREGFGVVQCKVVSRPIFIRDWCGGEKDAPPSAPLNYQLQVLAESILAQAAWGALACLWIDTFNAGFEIVAVERHAEAEERIRNECISFWAKLDAGEMPAVDYRLDSKAVELLYPRDDGEHADLSQDNELPLWAEEYCTLRSDIAEANKRRDELATAIKSRMKEAKTASLAGGGRLAWPLIKRKAFEVAANEFRRLTVTMGKGDEEDAKR